MRALENLKNYLLNCWEQLLVVLLGMKAVCKAHVCGQSTDAGRLTVREPATLVVPRGLFGLVVEGRGAGVAVVGGAVRERHGGRGGMNVVRGTLSLECQGRSDGERRSLRCRLVADEVLYKEAMGALGDATGGPDAPLRMWLVGLLLIDSCRRTDVRD